MKFMNKRIISLLLVLVMLVGMTPLTAFAMEETEAACGHAYENGSCTACGKKQSQQLVDGFGAVSSVQPGDSRLVDTFNTVSPLIYQDLTLFENCAITALNLFVTGTVVDNSDTNENDPVIDNSTEYTFDISVIDASSVEAGGHYSIKETYTVSVLGSELKKNDWNTIDVSKLGITVEEGETLGFGSNTSTLEIFYLNKCVSTDLQYFGHKTTTGDTSLSLRTNFNLLVGVEGYSLVEEDTTPEIDHGHSFLNGVCSVCGLSKKPYQRLTYFTVDVADENGKTYTDNAVLYLPANYSPDGEPVKLIIYCKQGGSTITSSSNPIEAVGFYNYLISLGYAVLGVDGVPDAWRDELVLDETRVVGNPLAVQGTEAAYDYVIDNYNIAADGCFISGYSQGGHYAQNVIDLTDIPILAAAEQSPVCSIRYHQWDLSSTKTIGGVSVTRPARLNVARIYSFPAFTTNAELLALEYDASLVAEYDPWVRNSENVYTEFVQKSNLWYLPEGTSIDDITMTHAVKCPVKIWCAEDDTAISSDVMKVFVKAIQNAGGTAEISIAPSGGHGFFQKQTAVGTFTENGKTYNTLPIAVEIADWFAQYGGYERKHTYENGICTACGEAQPGPVITQQPTNGEAKMGERYMVEVLAEGEGLTYQWYGRNAGSKSWFKSSVKDNTYDDVMTEARAGREVYCVITDANGNSVTTDTVKLVLLPSEKLEIITQPTDGEAVLGERFCITVEAKGEGLKYQWYFRNKGATNWYKSSVTDNTYDDVMNTTRDGREVYCVITDLAGNKVTTDIVKLVRVPMKLEILSQPTDATAAFGEMFCATVAAKGEGLKYQWYFRNAGSDTWHKSGVRDNTYDDVMTKARNGREVYCVITDKYGNSVTTDIVKLIAVPTVELKLLGVSYESAAMGERFCVTLNVQGEGLTYTWYFRNAGATRWSKSSVRDNTYDDVMNRTRANREVYCVITDAFGNQITTETVILISR